MTYGYEKYDFDIKKMKNPDADQYKSIIIKVNFTRRFVPVLSKVWF